MSIKSDFIDLYSANIKRDGSAALLEWLEKSDFFTAPASTKYHSCHEGGLCEHSIKVFNRLECDNPETRAIVSLLHDVCKANFYTVQMRNVKNEQSGQWEKKQYYAVDDQLPYGHGEKSVYIINGFMRLTREEAVAIRFHMGRDDNHSVDMACSAAFRKYPLALELHIADMRASYLDEKEE